MTGDKIQGLRDAVSEEVIERMMTVRADLQRKGILLEHAVKEVKDAQIVNIEFRTNSQTDQIHAAIDVEIIASEYRKATKAEQVINEETRDFLHAWKFDSPIFRADNTNGPSGIKAIEQPSWQVIG